MWFRIAPGFHPVGLVLLAGTMMLAGCNANIGNTERPLVTHGPIHGSVELSAEHTTDTQKSSQSERKSEANIFKEKLTVNTDGSVYHPNLLFYNAALGLGLTQQDLKSDENSGHTNGTLDEYNVFMQLLKEKKYPLTVNLSRFDDVVARSFLGPLQVRQENTTFLQSVQSKDWPMTFQYSTSKTTQEDVFGDANDFFSFDSKRFNYFLDHNFSKLSHMRIEFENSEVTQSGVGATTNIKENEFTFLHDLIFGADETHRLDTFVNYLEDTGTTSFNSTQWRERLRLQHTENLFTTHEIGVIESQRESASTKEVRGSTGFVHELYESLTTTGELFGSKTSFNDNGEATQKGGSLGFNYRKKNLWGTFLASYSAVLTQFDQSTEIGSGFILNESHTATELFPVELNRTNIDISTIRVKDSGGLLFQEGEDYTISVINGRTFLRIITVGGLTPPNFIENQRFFVDYSFSTTSELQEETLSQSLSLRQRFNNGLSVYFRHQQQDQTVSSTDNTALPDNFQTNTFGTDYSRKGLFLLAEYSKQDSSTIPWDSKRVEGRYSWPISTQTTGVVFASEQWLSMAGLAPRDTTLFRTGAEVISRLMDKYSLASRINYRDETDTVSGPTQGIQFISELRYNYRQISATTGFEYDLLDRNDNKTSTVYIYMRLKRSF